MQGGISLLHLGESVCFSGVLPTSPVPREGGTDGLLMGGWFVL